MKIMRITIDTDDKKSQESFSYRCAFCNGNGIDPANLVSAHNQCPVCKGRGKNHFRGNKENYSKCGSCRGRGRDRNNINRPCRACNGKGVYKKPI
ncbi:MAG TPA: hypothetical protein ENH51_04075 [Euryarchaeota archaeon]|nr:hypothetical protein [Euryarchaeota archaeon]